MRVRIAVPEEHVNPDVINAALESVSRLDEHMIRSGQVPTAMEGISSGVRWRPENFGDEHFDHAAEVLGRGWGDCDDLAPWHAGSLRATGEDPGARAVVVPSGPNTYHAIVERSDGSLDDPSIAAGMKAQRQGAINGESISVTACDPHDGRIYTGSLAPTVGPLMVHCGPVVGVRKAVVGGCHCFEGRCDLPIVGSALFPIAAPARRPGAQPRPPRMSARPRRPPNPFTSFVGGAPPGNAVPYAFSCTSCGPTPPAALQAAVMGAIMCGDAAGMWGTPDRYKLLAIQSLLAGSDVESTIWGLAQQMEVDTGVHGNFVPTAQAIVLPIARSLYGPLARAGAGHPVAHAVTP
jgi:hypothetical protein